MTHLVLVGRAAKQAEEEFLRELAVAAGVSSYAVLWAWLRRADLLVAAPRPVLVTSSAEQDARDVLPQSSFQGTEA